MIRGTPLLVALALVAAACSGSSADLTTTAPPPTTTSTTTTTATPAPIATTTTTEPPVVAFAISGVVFGTTAPMLVITNTSDQGREMEGHWLCQDTSYWQIPDVALGPGEKVAISLGGTVFVPPPDAVVVDGAADLGPIDPTNGEIALFSAGDFGDAASVVSYVEWGRTPHGCTVPAIEADFWPGNDFVETNTDTIGLAAVTLPADDPELWTVING